MSRMPFEKAAREFLDSAEESAMGVRDAFPGAIASYFFTDEWDEVLSRHARLDLEHLDVSREGVESRTMQTQATTRFHGNVTTFMAEARARI